MRYATVQLLPGPEGFHPVDRDLVDADGLERVAIRHFNRLDDASVVLLYQLRGDPDPIDSLLSNHDDVHTYSISQDGSKLHAYIHFTPNETLDSIFQLPQQYSLVVDTPIECLAEGGIRVDIIGSRETVTGALDSVPDGVTVELESMREYEPHVRRLFSMLTDRQQEILRTAIAVGYYDVPRNATYEDIGEELDIAPVTVGEHLRKIESRVLTEIVPDQDLE